MNVIKRFTPHLYRQIALIGVILLVINISLFLLGLYAILVNDSRAFRESYLGLYLVVAVVFVSGNFLMAIMLHRYSVASRKQAKSEHQALKNYERSINHLQVAADIARDATAQANLQGILDDAVKLICERFGFYHAGIFLVDEQTDYAVLRTAYGVEASHQMVAQQHRLKIGEEGIVGQVTATGQPHIVLNTDTDVFHYKNPALPKTQSELALPFRVGKQIIGALDVQSIEREAFQQDDVNILQTMADLLAVAIDKARLNEAVTAHADELEQRVLDRTQELELERAQLHAILESMNDGLIYDEELEPIYTNEALTNLTGYSRDEWDGLLQLIKPISMTQDEVEQLQKDLYTHVGYQGIWKKELKLTRSDGTEFDASVICTAVQRDPVTNHAKGAVTIIRDISQEKALDEQKSRFIANAAHELRTPLTNMKTRLYLIRHQPDKFGEHYDVLQSVSERMQRLVDDLLDMSRFERGKIPIVCKREHLQDLIHHVVVTQRPEAEAKAIQLHEKLTATPVYADVDRDRIIQVLTNLISNAINYTEAGEITVHLDTLPDQQLEMSVEDTGIGIKEDMIEKIFQPFVRANHTTEGTGLGLNIAREIVQLHGGQMTVDSVYGKGSKFTITLERADDNPSLS